MPLFVECRLRLCSVAPCSESFLCITKDLALSAFSWSVLEGSTEYLVLEVLHQAMQYHSRASVPQFSRRCSRRLSSIHAADIAAHSKSRERRFAIGSDAQHLTCESTRPSVRITQRTPLHLTVFLRRRMISSVELRIRGNGELASLRKTLSIVRRNHNSQRSGSLIDARLTQNGLWLIDKIAEQGTTKTTRLSKNIAGSITNCAQPRTHCSK